MDEGPVSEEPSLDEGAVTASSGVSMSGVSTSGVSAPGEHLTERHIADRVRRRLFSSKPTATRIGRFLVLEEIGRGGMGTVYAAYDDQLDRKVAIKVLLDEEGESSDDDLLRFQREAMALARLSHPNVVTIHEVGVTEGELYIAMEFLRGRSLRDWLDQTPPWEEVLDAVLQAGRGLAAAHAAGLVHRDLKPHNMMRSDDGLVKVLDFGLARAADDEEPVSSLDEIDSLSNSALFSALTNPGAVVGTPAYMSPEQLLGQTVDARSDQFSFCVTLYEALYGQRPFEGHVVSDLVVSMRAHRVRPAPRGSKVPARIRRTLLRGLAPEPEDRWPSMEVLLSKLERGRSPRRWRTGLAGLVVAVTAVGVAVGWQRRRDLELRQRVAACEAQGAAIDEAWNEQTRQELRSGLLSTGAHFARDSADTLIPWLDDYRDEWSAARTEVCVHGSVARDWDDALLDRASWCLEDRRLQLETTIDQLAASNTASVRRAVRIASYLDPVSTCLEPDTLRRLPVPPLEQRDEIRSILSMLASADRLGYSGFYARALEETALAVDRAETVGWPPLRAYARFRLGRGLLNVGRFEDADVALTEAYFEANEAGSTEVAFRSARSLMRALAYLQRYHEAEIWARHADGLSSSLTDPSGLDEAERHYLLIEILRGLGDYEAAAREGEQAVAERAAVLGSDHPITAAATRELGRVYVSQGRSREALELLERSQEIWETTVGHEHPYVGDIAVLRAGALRWQGRLDEALGLAQEGLSVVEGALRRDHPKVALALEELGRIQVGLGQLDEAERAFDRAIAARRSSRSRDPAVARGLLGMATVALRRGQHDVALARAEQVVELLEGVVGPRHPEVPTAMELGADAMLAMGQVPDAVKQRRAALARRESASGTEDRQLIVPLVQLGDLQRTLGELDEARRLYERALAIGKRVAGAEHHALVPAITGLAEVALARGDVASALSLAQRAVRIVENDDAGPRVGGAARFVLARALVHSGGSYEQARLQAGWARDQLTTSYDDVRLAAVQSWLAEQQELRPMDGADPLGR